MFSSSIRIVGWDRVGLTVGTNPGLLVSDRRFSPRQWNSDPSDSGETSYGLWLQKVSDTLVITSVLVPPIRVSRRITTGRDLFHTTHKVKTKQVVSLVLDLRVDHDRVVSSTDPTLNGHLRYPNNLDQSLNDTTTDKIRRYRADYSNNPPRGVAFMPVIASTSGRLHSELIRILFLQTHRETKPLFYSFRSSVSTIRSWILPLHYILTAFSSMIKSRVGNILTKAAVLRINLVFFLPECVPVHFFKKKHAHENLLEFGVVHRFDVHHYIVSPETMFRVLWRTHFKNPSVYISMVHHDDIYVFSFDRIFVCGYVLSWCMCVCMCTHGGQTYFLHLE